LPLLEVNVVLGDVADAVLDPVPVTASVPVHALAGVVNVALQVPPLAENPLTVDEPEQPPPYVAAVNPDGADTVYVPLPLVVDDVLALVRDVKANVGLDDAVWFRLPWKNACGYAEPVNKQNASVTKNLSIQPPAKTYSQDT
jgi:hypothetical protein